MPRELTPTAAERLAPVAPGAADRTPTLPAAAALTTEATNTLRAVAWRCHLGEEIAENELTPLGPGMIPALLDRFRDPDRIRHDYPLFLFATDAIEKDRLCIPLADLLAETLAGFAATPDDARILRENLDRLERGVRSRVDDADSPVDATETLDAAAKAMVEELGLGPTGDAQLRADLERLLIALPAGGRLLALTEHAALHLFVESARHRSRTRRDRLRQDAGRLAAALHGRLRLDRDQTPDGAGATGVTGAIGVAGAEHVDAEAFARIIGAKRGTETLTPGARARLEEVVRTLDAFVGGDEPPLLVIVSDSTLGHDACPDGIEWHEADDGNACRAAITRFDAMAADWARLLGAVRAARLFINGTYDPCRHDPLLDGFGWRAFTDEELHCLPPVVAYESANATAENGMLDLSHVLRSGRPIQVIIPVSPAASPGAEDAGDRFDGSRMELAYLGISHREALVQQSSAARPVHLLKGFIAGLDASGPSMHVVTSGLSADGVVPALGAWMHAGVALEGRAHPFVHYDPEAGATWARRVDFDENPQPDRDWPSYELVCVTADGGSESLTLAFTFADFALLEPRFARHFHVIPPGADFEELVPILAYLARSADDADDQLPFTWCADEDGRLHRVLVSRELAVACRDRLDFWRTLQELAGVRNEYVREAIAREREQADSEAAAEHARREETYEAALEQARSGAAREAMGRLARALLEADTTTLASFPAGLSEAPPPVVGSASSTVEPAATEPATEPAPTEPMREADDDDDDDAVAEPWIDSVLCTSCNDCLDINRQLFVYNGNKQAMIGDASAGTFAQLVQAAEKCPARCIHPGRPLDSGEPNLEELIDRAKALQ